MLETNCLMSGSNKEPTEKEIKELMKKDKRHTYYTAREELREKAYGGRPPVGYLSWGDYWKSY